MIPCMERERGLCLCFCLSTKKRLAVAALVGMWTPFGCLSQKVSKRMGETWSSPTLACPRFPQERHIHKGKIGQISPLAFDLKRNSLDELSPVFHNIPPAYPGGRPILSGTVEQTDTPWVSKTVGERGSFYRHCPKPEQLPGRTARHWRRQCSPNPQGWADKE